MRPPETTILYGDAWELAFTLEPQSVDCIVTSPPYWNLRDYGTGTWEGGDPECDHKQGGRHQTQGATSARVGRANVEEQRNENFRSICDLCGARRVDRQFGLEPTPQEYVTKLVDLFALLRPALKDHGTLWLNLGDSYASDTKGTGGDGTRSDLRRDGRPEDSRIQSAKLSIRHQSFQVRSPRHGLKPKDLCGIPWRVALALQEAGWYLRSDIIWWKRNPMPSSATDRPTLSHEYVFLLAKKERYFFDADAVREPNTINPAWNYGSENYRRNITQDEQKTDGDFRRPRSSGSGWSGFAPAGLDGSGRNLRTVWDIPTQPYPEAHYATFPPALVVPCIKAGTSEHGVCPECGRPWTRIVEASGGTIGRSWNDHEDDLMVGQRSVNETRNGTYSRRSIGWQAPCDHNLEPVPAVVLDPFMGSGTTAQVARSLGRDSIGFELDEGNQRLIDKRLCQQVLL